jgi:hypothetical protein
MAGDMRDIIRSSLASVKTKEAAQEKRTFLTKGEQEVVNRLSKNTGFMKALKENKIDRYMMVGALVDILPVPVSVCEKVAKKFLGMINEGYLKSDLTNTKKLTEAMATASGVASGGSDVDELGMYGIGDGANLPMVQGDADKGSTQHADRGSDAETAKHVGGYQQEGEASEATDTDDKDIKGPDTDQAILNPNDDKKKKDRDDADPRKKAEEVEEEEVTAESFIQQWRDAIKSTIPEKEEDKDDDDKDDKDDKKPSFMKKKDGDDDDKEESTTESQIENVNTQLKQLKTEAREYKEAIRNCSTFIESINEGEKIEEREEALGDHKAMKEALRVIKSQIRGLKEDRRSLKKTMREARETPDADPRLQLGHVTPVGAEENPGAAAVEGEELQPEEPGDGSQGPVNVVPSQDTQDALETSLHGLCKNKKPTQSMKLPSAAKKEGEELQPQEPGDGTQGKAVVSPVEKGTHGAGTSQNK